MMKYKVGDRVKILKSDGEHSLKESIGKRGTIKTVEIGKRGTIKTVDNSDIPYKVEFKDGDDYGWYKENEIKGKPHKLKAVTHMVVWMEDEDPYQMFTNEKDATAHALMLTKKEEVQKDSILFVEVKSVRKVTIDEKLCFKKYKI